jgi:hypothetical protein
MQSIEDAQMIRSVICKRAQSQYALKKQMTASMERQIYSWSHNNLLVVSKYLCGSVSLCMRDRTKREVATMTLY